MNNKDPPLLSYLFSQIYNFLSLTQMTNFFKTKDFNLAVHFLANGFEFISSKEDLDIEYKFKHKKNSEAIIEAYTKCISASSEKELIFSLSDLRKLISHKEFCDFIEDYLNLDLNRNKNE